MGLKPGDCVNVLEDNSIQAADFFLGCAIANVVRVPLYQRNSRESYIEMLRNIDSPILFAGASYAEDIMGRTSCLRDLGRLTLFTFTAQGAIYLAARLFAQQTIAGFNK